MLKDQATANRLWNRPLYLQLRDALAERIASGGWKPGASIPNESELAREFSVSAGTMRKALDLMEGERLLTRRQGRGTFVNDQASEELAVRFCCIWDTTGERIVGEVHSEQITEGTATETEAARLRLDLQSRVYRVRRILYHQKLPFMVEDATMPAGLFSGLTEKQGPHYPLIALCQRHGVLLGKAEERISMGSATQEVAEALGMTPASPILVLDRIVHSLDGRPVEWRCGRCSLDDKYYLAEMS